MKPKTSNIGQTSIDLIIHGNNDQPCVDSRKVAEEFGREHKNVLQTLDELLADGTISRLECKPSKYRKRGKEYRRYELNEAGFLKAMPFIGGRKSRQGQKRLIDEFLRLRRLLERQSKERETLAYQVARLSGKDSRGILTDTIQQFIEYARAQGSQSAEKYFSIITTAAHKAVVQIEPQATQVREVMTAIQLKTLELVELTAAQALKEGMDKRQPYKEIYQAVKAALQSFASNRTPILGG
jgi:Rha family phage regulatory protein